MPSYDDRTLRGWPLPFKSNTLEFDVERLRETFTAIDEALSAFEEGTRTLLNERVAGLEEKQYILDARMDLIAGQTTEDSEILDARVDAKGVIHPNVGHNVRTLHSEVIEINEALRYGIEEFRGLLRQFNDLAYAQMQGELNSQDAHDRRKQEIQRTNERIDEETQTRQDADSAIREELVQEQQTRDEQDETLQAQADELSRASLQNSLNTQQEAERRRKADNDIRSEIAQGMTDFAGALNEEVQLRIDVEAEMRCELAQEAFSRNEQDEALQTQTHELSKASIQSALTVRELNERRRAEISSEETARILGDEQLQSDVDELSKASLQHSLNLQGEAEQRRKVGDALTSEIAASKERDEALHQELVQGFSTTDERITHEEAERLKADQELQQSLDREEYARVSDDEAQQGQIDFLAKASLQDSLNLQSEIANRKSTDYAEAQARIIQGEVLQSEIDNLSAASLRQNLNAHHEATQRRAVNEALKSETTVRIETDNELREGIAERAEEIASESKLRASEDSALQAEIDDLSRGAIQDRINDLSLNERRKQDVQQEAHTRAEHDKSQQDQIDTLAQSGFRHSLNLHNEAEQRRKGFSQTQRQLDTQRERIEVQEEKSTHHQAEFEDLIDAMLRSSLNLHEALERRREALKYEAEIRSGQVQDLQARTQKLSEASIQQSLNSQREAEQRRELSSKTLSFIDTQLELNDYLQKQIADLVTSVFKGAKNLHDALERRREALSQEAQARTENDSAQQAEIDALSEASIRETLNLREAQARNRAALQQEALTRSEQEKILQDEISENARANLHQSLNLARESAKRRELSQVVAGIKSPVDWSKADSLAIPEPRCAVVNFTGLASMPTSKTADISAVLEFWDLQGNYFRKNIVCSAQGSSSLGYIKKNVKVDLLNEDGSEFDLKIGNWVVQDGFHLKAYYTDFFRGIGVTSYKLWDEVMETKPYKRALVNVEGMNPTATGVGNLSDLTLQIDTGALCHPDGFPCIVYLNGKFYGVFSWQIKKQRKNYHMDKSTVEHIHLDGTLSTANFWNGTINWTAFEIRNPNKLYTMDGKKYDGDAPRELIDETSEKYDPDNKDHVRSAKVKKYIQDFVQSFGVLKNLYAAYRASPSDEMLAAVKAKYEELFDWENQRDYLIFSDVIKNSDGYAKNWQWTTYDGLKWYVNAYDLDMSYGGDWQGRYITAPLTGHITTSTALPVYYVALLYHSELEARYRKLREAGIIDVEHIVTKLADWTARIGESNYELEYERWPNSPCLLNYNDSVDRIRKWLTVEIANMDKVYNYNPNAEANMYTQAIQAEAQEREAADESEALIRANEDEALHAQINDLSRGAAQDRINELALNTRRQQELQEETQTRREQNTVHDWQIQLLARAGLRRDLNAHKASERRKAEILQEILTRSESDQSLQGQINDLAFAIIQIALTDHEARERIKEYLGTLYQAVADTGNLTYMGAGVASTNEVSDMLSDVLSGSDAGEITGTGIPEELKNRVATSSEVSNMLAEIFPNNRS